MVKNKKTNRQIKVQKTQNRKLKTKQHIILVEFILHILHLFF